MYSQILLSVGQKVQWTKSPWNKASVGQKVCGTKSPWDKESFGQNVREEKSQGEKIPGKILAKKFAMLSNETFV